MHQEPTARGTSLAVLGGRHGAAAREVEIMWLVLLDHSSSMGDGFEASGEQATFRDRRTQRTVKLEAAVESVLIELRRLTPDTPVSLFGFTSSARLLYTGRAGAHADFEAALRRVSPTNGTDIAAALDGARAHVSGLASRPLVTSILLVTDGLSDLDGARRAARECAQAGLSVHVVLIDPTEEARDLAGAVAGETNGRWEPVYGPEDLARATADARTVMEALALRTQEAADQIAAEAAEIRAEQTGREQVLFTANYPGVLAGNAWHPLYVHVHTAHLRGQLEGRLAKLASRLGPRRRRGEAPAGSMIERGTELEIEPVVANVRCRPPRLPVVWNEEVEEASFEVAYAGQTGVGDVCHGSVLICAGGLLIAQIPVSFSVSADHDALPSALQASTARMISKVFGSYAHGDADMVARFRAAYRALGIHLFVDVLDIDGGVAWTKYLDDQIEHSDLFQLFWSSASAVSEAVEHEWRYALQVAEKRPPETHFIRPVFWKKPSPEPPGPLSRIQFWYFDPQNFGFTAPDSDGADPEGKSRPARRADVRFPVIQLQDNPGGVTARHIEDSLAAIVPFLEDVTGLRYYPNAM